MKFKGIELKGIYKVKFKDYCFNVYDENGFLIYMENIDGCWYKKEYGENGNNIHFQDNNGYWHKREYDANGNEVYFENSYGFIIDNRPKELTADEIETNLDKIRYVYVSNYLKNGCHIRAFYDNNELTYILYLKTIKIFKITNECFTQLIPNIEHQPSGRPCEECYVWKD